MRISKFSMGVGDRFAKEGKAQLKALMKAEEQGVVIAPVWNKSNREHEIIGSLPIHTRLEADEAVTDLGWKHDYYVDADHIGRGNVGKFMAYSDFFTIDVTDFIGAENVDIPSDEIEAFALSCGKYAGDLRFEGLDSPVTITEESILETSHKYFPAVKEAAAIYRMIEKEKGAGRFVTEISMDETDSPQTPDEMLIILAAIARENIPVQTIAPRFSGRFNKGVDYVGDPDDFAREFEADLAVIAFAVKEFGLPENLKLSVHSGSDKFAIYGAMNRALKKFNAGLHLKTAGTTWLEEIISLAEQGGDAYELVKEIYAESLKRFDELAGPYAEVIDIDRKALPASEVIASWSGERFAKALRHDKSRPEYDLNLRQMVHIAYKLASEKGTRFYDLLEGARELCERNVLENLYERHVKRIFL